MEVDYATFAKPVSIEEWWECVRNDDEPDEPEDVDDYTAIPWRGGMAADGPRYKALGNSMAVPCMAWIGRRIDAVEHMTPKGWAGR
jgi:site-specific DNA-cytosine methylase